MSHWQRCRSLLTTICWVPITTHTTCWLKYKYGISWNALVNLFWDTLHNWSQMFSYKMNFTWIHPQHFWRKLGSTQYLLLMYQFQQSWPAFFKYLQSQEPRHAVPCSPSACAQDRSVVLKAYSTTLVCFQLHAVPFLCAFFSCLIISHAKDSYQKVFFSPKIKWILGSSNEYLTILLFAHAYSMATCTYRVMWNCHRTWAPN